MRLLLIQTCGALPSHHRNRISTKSRIKYQIHLTGKGDEHVPIQTQTDRHSAIGAS
jgi:hypothetical protein